MGLFDNLKCKANLPEGNKELQEEIFQTKSLDCLLETYIITKNKKLVIETKKGTKTILYHGDIIFYTFTGNHEDKTYKWHEFIARFTNGKLQYIKKVKNPEKRNIL